MTNCMDFSYIMPQEAEPGRASHVVSSVRRYKATTVKIAKEQIDKKNQDTKELISLFYHYSVDKWFTTAFSS